MTNRSSSWGCVLLMVLPFLLISLWLAATDWMRLRTYRPVTARIQAVDVESVRSSKGSTSYKPRVDYSYTVDGREYNAHRVHPLEVSTGFRGWAESEGKRFHPGQEATAYYDPKNPSQAFLVHELSFFPFAIALFLALFAGIATAVSQLKSGGGVSQLKSGAASEGWRRLAQRHLRFGTAIVALYLLLALGDADRSGIFAFSVLAYFALGGIFWMFSQRR